MTDPIELPGQQGAAEKFVARYGDRFRYSAAWKKYIAWDGKRWNTESGTVHVRGLWQQHLRDTLKWIADNVPHKEMPDALAAVEARSNVHWENAMLTLCQARAPIDYRELDAEPNLLNCENGILDLADGKLYDHDPKALCTRFAPVAWDADANCPKWISFLNWAMQGDAERVAYLQRFFGLCLTGDAEHELAHFFWGDGGNGKTTAIKTLEKILGDYARRAPARVLMQRKHESHPTELAGMCGRRLVVFAETNENQTLDEQMLKVVASKDVISARRMHEDFWDFAPTHKAVLLTNNRPRIRGQDEGVWRRIVLVEWGASVTEADKDPHFADRFDAELPGILRWAWDGLQAARGGGLRPPTTVRDATAAYRGAEDSVPQWIEAACVLEPSARTSAGELYASYSAWAEQHFETRLTQAAFGKRLEAAGCLPDKGTGGVRVRLGIRLKQHRGSFLGR